MRGWHLFWTVWFFVTFVLWFLPAEIYCLVKRNGGTLSEAIWYMEGYKPGQRDFANPLHWGAGHFGYAVIMAGMFAWLTGHFLFRIWH